MVLAFLMGGPKDGAMILLADSHRSTLYVPVDPKLSELYEHGFFNPRATIWEAEYRETSPPGAVPDHESFAIFEYVRMRD